MLFPGFTLDLVPLVKPELVFPAAMKKTDRSVQSFSPIFLLVLVLLIE